ncbi:Solute carrier family 25 member 38-like [Hondaea fermentalgiana]|uniref:Solute carrier family 25 member 38-like n=1 Tax=Hondaea fermentalgiana TaxID=2315210 RepID=A0A2R5GDU3_9STRA|nr:Solute carrier family 25 member 38-like [Hondaea fermentalgiana]|eukprot:GBG29110.1 Solute carrier family 25 member 38-like [Hondaea fermentalgiana]
MGKEDDTNELRAVLQRQVSGRDDETTFEMEGTDTDMDKKTPVQGGVAAAAKAAPVTPVQKESLGEILERAGKRAIGGGLPGAMAMGVQVLSLMWLRTTVNYQYRNGGTMREAFSTLYKEGGIRRFYRGVGPGLFQGPLSRFGDTASNAGMLALLDSSETTATLPVAVKTAAASFSAATFRIFLMPIDAAKTSLQVNGKDGLRILSSKMKVGGPQVLWAGALGSASATFVGHYPWFFTYNTLNEMIPMPAEDDPNHTLKKLSRNAVIGFSASAVSDTVSNSIRVLKVTKQTSAEPITYPEAFRQVVAKDGLSGVFFRGLQTKILANGLQGMLFTVLWKQFEQTLFKQRS